MKEIIDLSSDASTSSNVSSGNSVVSERSEIIDKRKREEVEMVDSSPSKIKKEDIDVPIDDDTFVKETSTVVKYTAMKSTTTRKNPLEDDTIVSTTVTERVAISSPTGVIRRKNPVDDEDEDLVFLTGIEKNIAVKNALKDPVNLPPWWYHLATDIGDDIISKLSKK